MLKQFTTVFLCLVASQVSFANQTSCNSNSWDENRGCVLLSSKDKQVLRNLQLNIHTTEDIISKSKSPDSDSAIAPHTSSAQAFTDANSAGQIWYDNDKYTFNYLRVNFNSVFLGTQKIPASNCQINLTPDMLKAYVGRELKISFETDQAGKVTCHINNTKMTHCQDMDIDSLATQESMSFESRYGLCMVAANNTNLPLDIADLNAHTSQDVSLPLIITADMPYGHAFDTSAWSDDELSVQTSIDYSVVDGYYGKPIPGCQLHTDNSNIAQYQGKIVNFQIQKTGNTYTCTKVIKDYPASSFHKTPKAKPHKRLRRFF